MGRYIPNEYVILDGDMSILKIESNKFGSFDIMISTCDVDKCKKYTWSINSFKSNSNSGKIYFYVVNNKIGMLHRYLTECPKGKVVDHVNGDTLNNTIGNLNVVDKKDNERKAGISLNNKSGTTGVLWNNHIPTPKWMAYIKVDKKFINLGYFDRKEDAIKARKNGEVEYFGEFIPIHNALEKE